MRKDSVLLSYYYDKLPKKALGGGIDAPLRNGNNKGAMNGFQLNQKKEGGWLSKYSGGGLTFLEPNSKKLPQGYKVPYSAPSSELAASIGGENGEPAYLIPTFKYGHPLNNPLQEFRQTGEHLGGPFKTWQEADEWDKNIRHPYVEKGQPIPTPLKTVGVDYDQANFKNSGWLDTYATGGSIVDYLESIDQDSSKANRAKLAKFFGIDNYNYQGDQNLELLRRMQAANQQGSAPVAVSNSPAPVGSISDVSQYNTGNNAPIIQPIRSTVRNETPKQLPVQQPLPQQPVEDRNAVQTTGYAPPLFANTADRDAYRKRLTELGKKIVTSPNDEQYLAKLNGIHDASGNLMGWGSDENCINGVCGVNIAAGLKYNHPTYQDRYIGNRTFYDAVNNHQEDYYRVNGNFQVGDHVQFMDRSTDNKGHVIY